MKTPPLSPSNPQQQGHHHAFETNALDHCETPPEAYAHVCSFLKAVAAAQSPPKPAKDWIIWDPYYCNGSMKRIFQELGFKNIIHDNVDFYQLIQDGTIPDHDVLITNPPYSEHHIEKLLQFVVTHELPNHRPSCLLLPNWVSRQATYSQDFVEPLKLASVSAESSHHELLYLSPIEPYTYTMPTWLPSDHRPDHVAMDGKTTPYLTSWYLVVPNHQNPRHNKSIVSSSATSNSSSLTQKQAQKSVLEHLDKVSRKQRPVLWVVAKTVKGLKWKIQKVRQQQQQQQQTLDKEGPREAQDQQTKKPNKKKRTCRR